MVDNRGVRNLDSKEDGVVVYGLGNIVVAYMMRSDGLISYEVFEHIDAVFEQMGKIDILYCINRKEKIKALLWNDRVPLGVGASIIVVDDDSMAAEFDTSFNPHAKYRNVQRDAELVAKFESIGLIPQRLDRLKNCVG